MKGGSLMLYEIKAKVNDDVRIILENGKGEFSSYILTVNKLMLEGDGLDFFLEETTGFEERIEEEVKQ
jgi:hypothetical protein